MVLGQASARVDDPYVLSGHWIDVDVESEGDGFAVLARTDEMGIARQVLERAQRYSTAASR